MVTFSLRGSWYSSLKPDVLVQSSLLDDRTVDDYRQQPRLSVLFHRQPHLLSKSLTCSQCDTLLSYWSCSHADCHLSLCARCHSAALYPTEESANAAPSSDGRLAVSTLCSAFAATRQAFPRRLWSNGPHDRSFLIRPLSLFSINGLGSCAQTLPGHSALQVTRRSSHLVQGFGLFPFVLTVTKQRSLINITTAVSDMAAHLRATRSELCCVDIRCHQLPGGYEIGSHVFTAYRIFHELILPAVVAFLGQLDFSPPLPVEIPAYDRILVVAHFCDGKPATWLTMMLQAVSSHLIPHGFDLLLVQRPLLLYDNDHMLPMILPLWTNRRCLSPMSHILGHALSPSFIGDYHPVLLTDSRSASSLAAGGASDAAARLLPLQPHPAPLRFESAPFAPCCAPPPGPSIVTNPSIAPAAALPTPVPSISVSVAPPLPSPLPPPPASLPPVLPSAPSPASFPPVSVPPPSAYSYPPLSYPSLPPLPSLYGPSFVPPSLGYSLPSYAPNVSVPLPPMRLPSELSSHDRRHILDLYFQSVSPSTLQMFASFSQSQLASALNVQLPFLVRSHYNLPMHLSTPHYPPLSSTGSTIAGLRARLRDQLLPPLISMPQ